MLLATFFRLCGYFRRRGLRGRSEVHKRFGRWLTSGFILGRDCRCLGSGTSGFRWLTSNLWSDGRGRGRRRLSRLGRRGLANLGCRRDLRRRGFGFARGEVVDGRLGSRRLGLHVHHEGSHCGCRHGRSGDVGAEYLLEVGSRGTDGGELEDGWPHCHLLFSATLDVRRAYKGLGTALLHFDTGGFAARTRWILADPLRTHHLSERALAERAGVGRLYNLTVFHRRALDVASLWQLFLFTSGLRRGRRGHCRCGHAGSRALFARLPPTLHCLYGSGSRDTLAIVQRTALSGRSGERFALRPWRLADSLGTDDLSFEAVAEVAGVVVRYLITILVQNAVDVAFCGELLFRLRGGRHGNG